MTARTCRSIIAVFAGIASKAKTRAAGLTFFSAIGTHLSTFCAGIAFLTLFNIFTFSASIITGMANCISVTFYT